MTSTILIYCFPFRRCHQAQHVVVSQLAQPCYTTRTSNAGTLLISEESFNGSIRRRRRQRTNDREAFSSSLKKDNAPGSSAGTMGTGRNTESTRRRSLERRDVCSARYPSADGDPVARNKREAGMPSPRRCRRYANIDFGV